MWNERLWHICWIWHVTVKVIWFMGAWMYKYGICVFFYINLLMKSGIWAETVEKCCRLLSDVHGWSASTPWQTHFECSAFGCAMMLRSQNSECWTWVYMLTWAEHWHCCSWSVTSRLGKAKHSTLWGRIAKSWPGLECLCHSLMLLHPQLKHYYYYYYYSFY